MLGTGLRQTCGKTQTRSLQPEGHGVSGNNQSTVIEGGGEGQTGQGQGGCVTVNARQTVYVYRYTCTFREKYYQLHCGLPRHTLWYKLLAQCTTPYGGVNHGVTILSPINHTFYWPKIIFKHVFGQYDVQ